MDFMLESKPAKIKYHVLIQPVEYGGINLVDLESKVTSLKMNWIKRLILDQGISSDILKIILKTEDLVNYFQFPTRFKTNYKFYNELLEAWQYLRDSHNLNKNIILNQSIWNNPEILLDNKQIMWTKWKNAGIQIV